jgi:type 1 glutamine amidotransferase
MRALLLLTSVLLCPVAAQAQIDCPLRDQPYSIDSPLIDVLLKPEAKALVAQQMPDMVGHLPPQMFGTTAPSFAAIMSLRTMAAWGQTPDATLKSLDASLKALPVTAADRQARCARYDEDRADIKMPPGKPRLLLFEKINGFRDAPSVEAASRALRDMAQKNGWALVETDKGGAISPSVLKNIDAVIWNNVSGDVLTIKERNALRSYMEKGGGFVAFHGSGGDPVYFWDWYVDSLIGARFKNHPMNPQFQDARIHVEDDKSALSRDLAPGWTMNDEWYSFQNDPREGGAHVIATLDESSYSPKGMGGQDLHMGDHPIAWTRCVGAGRSFYSAIGHRPETYTDPHYAQLLQHAIEWAATGGAPVCPERP